ncbi:MAG: glycosyltransferase family 39 protein, partial [Anaerolineae bacterium]|nr:glycosyltransferase family 39 protein [Anaerolineae bacterium]
GQALTPLDGVVLYAVASALFVWGAPPRPQEGTDAPLPRVQDWWVWALGGVGLACGIIAGGLFWRNWGDPVALALWVGSVLLFGGAAFLADRGAGPRRAPPRGVPRRWAWLLLACIVLLAFAVRAWRVDLYPNGCQSDECNNGMDALRWLRGLPYTPFRLTNEGQATLFTYILALFFRLFGASVPTMRLASAVAGALTVWAFYFLARDLYGDRAALLGTALLAGSRWHLTFSRIVYEAILTPLCEVLAFWLLLRGLRDRRWRDLVLAGMALGLGLHTYTAFRVVPLVAAAFVGALALVERRTVRATWPGLLAGMAGMLLVLNPLGLYAVRHPQHFLGRTIRISVFHEVRAVGNWSPVWSNLRKTLGMLHYQGDPASLHNLPGAPMLDVWVGALVALGVAYMLWRWRRREHLLYLFWAAGVLALGVLSAAHEAPTSRRTIGLIPLVYLLATAVLDRVWATFRDAWQGRGEAVLASVLATLAVASGVGNAYTYFAKQAVHPSVWAAYSPNESAVGKYLASLQSTPRLFLAQEFQRHSAIHFIARDPEYEIFNLARHLPVRDPDGRDVLYILDPVGEKALPLLQRFYPQAQVEFHRDRYGYPLFISIWVPAEQVLTAQGVTGRYYAHAEPEGTPALTRRDAQIAFDWSAEPPLEPPFSVVWDGAFLAPEYGDYTFEVRAPGTMALRIDGLEVARTEDGIGAGHLQLAGGFHDLEVTAVITETGGPVHVAVRGPDLPGGPIPTSHLYNVEVPPHGLMGYYRRGIGWDGPPQAIQVDWFIFPNDILPAPFSIEWRGKIRAPVTGLYTFGTSSDDGSYVYIDGQLVVDNGGSHGNRYREGQIFLEAGYHDLVVQYFQEVGSREMELWWTPPGGPHEIVPLEVLWTGFGEAPSPAPAMPPAAPTPPAPVAPPAAGAWEVAFDRAWGTQGAEPGQFQDPRGVAVDAAGNVYVADTGNRRIQKFTADGALLQVFGQDAGLKEPFDLAVAPNGDLYVLDPQSDNVAHFGPDGAYLGRLGVGIGLFRPRGLAVDAAGNLYLADTGRSRVLKLAPTGQVLAEVCTAGDGPGQVRQPTDVAVAPDGSLYVVDPSLRLVQRLDAQGRYVQGWTIPAANTFDGPHLAWHPSGLLLVTEPEGHQVYAYDGEGRLVTSWGGEGSGPGQFAKPIGIAVGPGGEVLVTDPL